MASKKITGRFFLRTPIFIVVALLFVAFGILDIATITCEYESPKNYTYRCALSLMVIFIYLRIYHWLKIAITIACLVFYGLVITNPSYLKFGQPLLPNNISSLFNQEYFGLDGVVDPEERSLSHVIYLVIVAVLLWLMDRQYEYLRRLDYQWKRQLKDEQYTASVTKLVNRALLQNILPLHVAEHYLSTHRDTGELFSEKYEKVAVIFAAMPDFMESFKDDTDLQAGLRALKALNEIIRGLDMLLFEEEFSRVEKIKVISSTYMAACGLQPGRKNSLEDRALEPLSTGSGSNGIDPTSSFADPAMTESVTESVEPFSRGDNASVMARFAAAMMRAIKTSSQDDDGFSFQMRIGFNVGPVIAGVVGANKPLYDIWGDTVNVASRMESKGVKGHIQVPEATAKELKGERISCTFRDTIVVKGKGSMRTHYVDLTDDQYLVEMGPMIMPSFHIGDEDDVASDNEIPVNGRFIVTPAMERRKSQHQLHVNESTDNGSTSSRGSSSSDDELEENEPVMVVVEAELHASNAIDVAAAAAVAEPVDEDTESTCSEMSNNSATKEEQDQVLSFLDHVLANEDDERLPDTHGHTLQQHTNSITNKKDSGYGSQGHLKLEINAIAAAAAAGELRSGDEFAEDSEAEEENQDVVILTPTVDKETAARFYEYLRKEDDDDDDDDDRETESSIGNRRQSTTNGLSIEDTTTITSGSEQPEKKATG